MWCRHPTNSSPAWLRSSNSPARASTSSTSRRSACTTVTRSGAVSIAARENTSGSLSTYTTRAPGSPAWATSCTFGRFGSPLPMSMNCRIPASRRKPTARARNRRLPRTVSRISGMNRITCSAAARSASKLSVPPSQ